MSGQGQLPCWAEWLSAIGPVFVSAFAMLVSAFSVYLSHKTARWQAYVAREMIRQNNYDRRFEVFKAFRELLVSVLEKDDAESELRNANAARAASDFLLNEQVGRYLEELHNEAFRLNANSKLLKDPSYRPSIPSEQFAKEASNLGLSKLRLADRVTELAEKFKPFLRPEETRSAHFP